MPQNSIISRVSRCLKIPYECGKKLWIASSFRYALQHANRCIASSWAEKGTEKYYLWTKCLIVKVSSVHSKEWWRLGVNIVHQREKRFPHIAEENLVFSLLPYISDRKIKCIAGVVCHHLLWPRTSRCLALIWAKQIDTKMAFSMWLLVINF